jgi:hypothetical protein
MEPSTQDLKLEPQGAKQQGSAFSLRDLLHIVPAFSAPALSWSQKVTLLTKAMADDDEPLLDVIKSKLPEPLFT